MTTLAFYRGTGDWRDAVIRQVTGSVFSHVELVGPDGWCISASKRDGNKVRLTQIDFKSAHWSFLTTCHDPEETWLRAKEHLDKPYDSIGAVLAGGLELPVHIRPDAWYCNEHIAYSLGLPKPWPPHPGALYDILT